MSTGTTLSLLALPDELLRAIFEHVSAPDLARLQLTCRRLKGIGSDPLLWESECLRTFRWWDKHHELDNKRRNIVYSAWKILFANRWISNRAAAKALSDLMHEETGRLDRIKDILDLGYDAKDVLFANWQAAEGSEMYLAQRYWSHAVLGSLHRIIACEEWKRLGRTPEIPNATERSLAALDMFVLGQRAEGDIDDIFARLDSYAASVREANPEIDALTPRQKAITIASHLRERQWVGIFDDRNYHSIDHMFLGVALFSTNRNSVPLISAIIFCYVVRQFGLRAQPISYPFHVHALVHLDPSSTTDLDDKPLPSTPPEQFSPQTHLFMDPFNTADPVPASHLLQQLRFIAPTSTPSQISAYLSPSSARDLTIRAAHNILAAPSHYNGPPAFPITMNAAAFGALLALILLPNSTALDQHPHPAQLSHHLSIVAQHFAIHFDQDVELFSTHVLPVARGLNSEQAYYALIQRLRRRDADAKRPKLRSAPGNEVVQYKVGQVFRHKLRGYLAVIYGWDSWCKMDEQWIVQNSVDRLPDGRGQPFYNVVVDDESSRYVAQENVILLAKDELDGFSKIEDRFPLELGIWFKRYDKQRGVFVSNVREEYPED